MLCEQRVSISIPFHSQLMYRRQYSIDRSVLSYFTQRLVYTVYFSGYISDPLLFKENAAALRKKLQDLSAIPPKYNLHIFYTPCLYSQSELEEQTYSGTVQIHIF